MYGLTRGTITLLGAGVAGLLIWLATQVDDGSNGLLVPVGDARALADALVRLLLDPGRAAAMGPHRCAALQRWREHCRRRRPARRD